MTGMTTPRYTFDRFATRHSDGCYSVSAVTDRGWMITWFVEPKPESRSGWSIWKPTPSNEPAYITPSGSLAKRILKVVAATQARFDDQAIGGV